MPALRGLTIAPGNALCGTVPADMPVQLGSGANSSTDPQNLGVCPTDQLTKGAIAGMLSNWASAIRSISSSETRSSE